MTSAKNYVPQSNRIKPQNERMNAMINIIIIRYRIQLIALFIWKYCYVQINSSNWNFEGNNSAHCLCANASAFFVDCFHSLLFDFLFCLGNNRKIPVHVQNMINGQRDCSTVKNPTTTSLILCLWSYNFNSCLLLFILCLHS